MRYFIIIYILSVIFVSRSEAQWKVKSVDIGPVFSSGSALKNTFNNVEGLGMEANVKVSINKTFGFLLSIGYSDLKVGQDNPITNWNWGFYNQSYSRLISSQLTDTTYQARFVPRQHLYLVPVSALFTGEITPSNNLSVLIGAGGGIQMFQRHLWVHEYWSKYYPDYNYTYKYDFDNDAGLKNGTIFFLKSAAQAEYSIFKHFGVTLRISALYYLDAFRPDAYKIFPAKVILSAGFGLIFYY